MKQNASQPVLLLATAIALGAIGASAVLEAEENLCQGLVQDRLARALTPVQKPALGNVVVDPQFGTRIRRISAIATNANPKGDEAIRPMYSTTAAWNADESFLILYEVGKGHRLHDGWTYAFIRYLDIAPPDLEQVYWDDEDPDILYYIENKTLIRYHVLSGTKETKRRFDFCQGPVRADPHAFTSWSSDVLGLRCDSQIFVYDLARDLVTGSAYSLLEPPMVAASGERSYFHGYVLDGTLAVQRQLDIAEPGTHLSLGLDGKGRDVLNGAMYDPGPRGSDVGSLVSFDLATGDSRVIVGPGTGFPYPPSGTHVASLVRQRPGWVFVSIIGEPEGPGVLDSELLLANVDSGMVCRIGRHRSWGKNNTRLAVPYWAEPHVMGSPSGTRALFASDWGNGRTVDAYVAELPAYAPPSPGLHLTLEAQKPTYRPGERLVVSMRFSNVGASPAADVYFLVVLPDARILAFRNWSFAASEVGSEPLSSWPSLTTGTPLPHSFTVVAPEFFGANLTASIPAGDYLFALLAIRSGSFADDRVDPGDVLGATTASFTIIP